MTLHLTRDEWERIAADGGGVLFRAGAIDPCDHKYYSCADIGCTGPVLPPAEFVEAAKPCWWCSGRENRAHQCPEKCLDGKRRITVAVEHLCFHEGQRLLRKDVCDCGTDDGLVTVGHVVVTWGPLVVVEWGDHYDNCIVLMDGALWVWRDHSFPDGVLREIKNLPPGVDPATLIGQYAIGIKVVEP